MLVELAILVVGSVGVLVDDRGVNKIVSNEGREGGEVLIELDETKCHLSLPILVKAHHMVRQCVESHAAFLIHLVGALHGLAYGKRDVRVRSILAFPGAFQKAIDIGLCLGKLAGPDDIPAAPGSDRNLKMLIGHAPERAVGHGEKGGL